jgi:hypothetical protein
MHPIKQSLVSLTSPVVAFFYEAAATNTLLRFASVVAVGVGMARCVPAKSYDEARTAAEGEFSAHGRTRARLEAAHERIRALEQSLAERERALETGASSMAEAKLETVVASKDKEAAMELVEQLRSELARTGNHLVAYSDEKKDLARALLLAEERVRAIEAAERNLAELVATTRDLSLALGPGFSDSGLEVGARDGQVVLRVPSTKLFAGGSDALVVDAAPVLGAVSKVTSAHPKLSVVLQKPDGDALAAKRVARLGAALVDRGVPEARLRLPAVETVAAPVAAESAPENAGDASVALSAVPLAAPTAAPVPSAAPAAPSDAEIRYEIVLAL